jgi:hypothetical protein
VRRETEEKILEEGEKKRRRTGEKRYRGEQENRRKKSKKLGRRGEVWEKKIQRQGGKCRGEETERMD